MGTKRQRPARDQQPTTARPDGGRAGGRPGSVLSLQQAMGNRAVGSLLARQPTATAKSPAKPPAGPAATADEILAAEAWVTYVSLRGNGAEPKVALPARYRGLIETLKAGIAGNPGEPDHLDIAGSATLLKRLRAEHDKVIPKADHRAFDLAELALKRALVDVGKGPDAFEGGATQMDYGQNLAYIWTEAGDELKAAKAAGYTIPDRLATAEEEARALYDAAQAGWVGKAPSSSRLITPADEEYLVEFRRETTEVINSMRAKRAADEARARRAEAEALQAAADKQMAELHRMMAEKRREAFRSGSTGKLKKLHEATGEVVRAIDDTKDAASIITSRVDQLNSVADMLSKGGGKMINLPAMPEGLTKVTGKIKSANEKLGKVIELLDLAGPAKTQLDEGLKYLHGVDLALEHFGDKEGKANPFIAVYVKAYLGPGIKNCIALIGNIAGRISEANRSMIEQDRGDLVNWQVEPGGEAVYGYLRLLFKQGAAVTINEGAYAYFSDHDDDLSAAVNDPMPGGRGAIGPWAYRNRYLLWEAFYGATRPPVTP